MDSTLRGHWSRAMGNMPQDAYYQYHIACTQPHTPESQAHSLRHTARLRNPCSQRFRTVRLYPLSRNSAHLCRSPRPCRILLTLSSAERACPAPPPHMQSHTQASTRRHPCRALSRRRRSEDNTERLHRSCLTATGSCADRSSEACRFPSGHQSSSRRSLPRPHPDARGLRPNTAPSSPPTWTS